MNDLKQFLIDLPIIIGGILMGLFVIAFFILFLLTPFFVIGLGTGFIVWATCLPLPFC